MNGVTDRVADMGDLDVLQKKLEKQMTFLLGSIEALERDFEILAQKMAALKVANDRLHDLMLPVEAIPASSVSLSEVRLVAE